MKKLTNFAFILLSLVSLQMFAQTSQEDLKTQKEALSKNIGEAIEKLDASINVVNQRMTKSSSEEKGKLITLKNEITLERLNLEAFHAKIGAVEANEWPETQKEIKEALAKALRYFELDLTDSK